MWEHTNITGPSTWLAAAISTGTLIAATDGSYMRHLAPDTCASAFILECTAGSGRFTGTFATSGPTSNAYRGELLGLLAVNLVLWSVAAATPDLHGVVPVYCNCQGAIRRIQDIPQSRLPTKTKHADILKMILLHSSSSTVTPDYRHISAHQDTSLPLEALLRPAQLNCECDYRAKEHLLGHLENPPNRILPREPLAIMVTKQKVTTDSGMIVRYHIGKQLAQQLFHSKGILQPHQFDLVDWRSLSRSLTSVPKLYQLWAAKHVMGAAGTKHYLSYQTGESPLCSSCQAVPETTTHITRCQDSGRQEAMSL